MVGSWGRFRASGCQAYLDLLFSQHVGFGCRGGGLVWSLSSTNKKTPRKVRCYLLSPSVYHDPSEDVSARYGHLPPPALECLHLIYCGRARARTPLSRNHQLVKTASIRCSGIYTRIIQGCGQNQVYLILLGQYQVHTKTKQNKDRHERCFAHENLFFLKCA